MRVAMQAQAGAKNKRNLHKKISRLSDQQFSFFNAAYNPLLSVSVHVQETHSALIFRQPIALCARHPMSSGTSKQRVVRELPKKRRRTEVSVSLQWQPWCRRQAQQPLQNRVAFGADAPQHPASGTCPHAARRAFRLIEGGENHGSSFNPARTLVHASLARRGCPRCRDDDSWL